MDPEHLRALGKTSQDRSLIDTFLTEYVQLQQELEKAYFKQLYILIHCALSREVERRKREFDPVLNRHGVLHKQAGDERLHYWQNQLEKSRGRRHSDYNALVIIYTDADRFKAEINDRFGQKTGDEAIELLAMISIDSVRRDHDFVIHDGGDEFVLVLPVREEGPTTAEHIAQLVIDRNNELCHLVSDVLQEDGNPDYTLRNSYGVTIWRVGEGDILSAKQAANTRMKINKETSGNSRPVALAKQGCLKALMDWARTIVRFSR